MADKIQRGYLPNQSNRYRQISCVSPAVDLRQYPPPLWSSFCPPLSAHPLMAASFSFPIVSDSDNSLLRYLSDDKILVIEEEPEVPSRESRRDSTRRSRRKSRNPSSPSFPISPSMLSSTLRLDQLPDALPVCTHSTNRDQQ